MINAKLALCAVFFIGSIYGMQDNLVAKEATLKLDILIQEFGLNPDKRDDEGWTLLHRMLVADDIEIDVPLLQEFKRRGGKIDDKLVSCDESEESLIMLTPLMIAIGNYNAGRIRALIECGADVTVRDSDGLTALHYLCSDCDYADDVERGQDLIPLFLAHGADIQVQSMEGQTPFKIALIENFDCVCKQLLKHGADPFFGGPESDALVHVIKHGKLEEQRHYARLWFDLPKKRPFMAILLSFKRLGLPKRVQNKILFHSPECVPYGAVPALFVSDEDWHMGAQLLRKFNQQERDLIEKIKACLTVNKKNKR